ncbi:hypothetical protein N0V82_009495 [Gnomoniopsis sp. IMI 355080]|nr:hypothetical protein N0V82_009495 [Gnomoniopsis sp. IMI 355080]
MTMPEVLATRGWDCAAAVELNIWVKMMRKQEHRLFNATLTDLEIDRASFYKSLCDIRHTAVHRLPMTAAGIEKCLRDGELLANLIDDSAAATRISTMRCEVQRVSTEMEDHKCMLEAKMNRTLERIAAERAELDRQEREAIEGTAQADEEYQLYAAANLEQRLANCEDDVTTESETSGSMMMAMRTVWNMSGSSWERLWTTLRSSAFDRFVSPEQLDGSVDAQT